MLDYLAGEGGISLLDVNPGLIIWTTVTFMVVMLVLRFFAWRPIVKALDARSNKIHLDLDRAEAVRKEAEEKLQEYTGKLNSLRKEGQDIMAESRKAAEEIKQDIIESARREAEEIKARGLRDIQHALDHALETYHVQVVNVSVAVASQILGKKISADEQREFVLQTVQKLKSMN